MEWIERDRALHLEVTTPDFKSSLALVNGIGKLAEEANHHPDLEFGWGYLRIGLTSHDAGGVTERDYKLAEKIQSILAQHSEADQGDIGGGFA